MALRRGGDRSGGNERGRAIGKYENLDNFKSDMKLERMKLESSTEVETLKIFEKV